MRLPFMHLFKYGNMRAERRFKLRRNLRRAGNILFLFHARKMDFKFLNMLLQFLFNNLLRGGRNRSGRLCKLLRFFKTALHETGLPVRFCFGGKGNDVPNLLVNTYLYWVECVTGDGSFSGIGDAAAAEHER